MDATLPPTPAPTRAALVVAVLRTALTGGPAFALRFLPASTQITGRKVVIAGWRVALARDAPFRWRPHIVPAALVVALIAGTMSWNLQVGLLLRPSPLVMAVSNIPLFAIAAICARLRRAPRVAEIVLYLGLWASYAPFATLLSYLGIGIGFPLQDHVLAAADAALGFDWLTWSHFMARHPVFLGVQGLAYLSFIGQPVASVVILALCRPGHRNAELLTAIIVGMLLTQLIAALAPALGPAVIHGRTPVWLPTLLAVRSHVPGTLGYQGILTFPSFHAVMAVLFTFAQRGIRGAFLPFLALNLLLLLSTPLWGGHYMTDVIGGAVVAVVAILVTRRLLAAAAAACVVSGRTA